MKYVYEVFNHNEFDSWSGRKGLIHEERYLFQKYILSKDKNIEILDVGTGNGRFLFELAMTGFAKLYGIDMSERLLNVAKNRAKETKQAINFYQMDASKLSFENDSFDLIIALQQVTSFIPTKEGRMAAIDEYYRVLKQDGLLVMSVLDYDGRWFNPILGIFCGPIKCLKADFRFLNHKYLPTLSLGGRINYEYLYKLPLLSGRNYLG